MSPDFFTPPCNVSKKCYEDFINSKVTRTINIQRRIQNPSEIVNPFQPSAKFHIETSHLTYTANQMTGFYVECNTGLKWVKRLSAVLLWMFFFNWDSLHIRLNSNYQAHRFKKKNTKRMKSIAEKHRKLFRKNL